MNSVHFELSRPLEYTSDQKDVECNFIELRAPTGKHTHICCAVESIIQTALIKSSEYFDEKELQAAKEAKEDKPKSEPLDSDAVIAVMNSGGVDMEKIVVYMRELFRSVAYMGGEKLITSPRLDDMSHKDLRRMIGVYIGNFILS